MKISKINLRNLFAKGQKPKQEAFWNWIDSFWHKDEEIEQSSVKGLEDTLANKLDKGVETTLLNSFNDAVSKVNSIIKGEATPTSSPTAWVPGGQDIFEKWEAMTVGTYTNFKDLNNQPIEVIAADLDKKIVFINMTNGVAKKDVKDVPGVIAKKDFDPTNDEDPSTMEAAAKRYDPAVSVLSGFFSGGSEFVDLSNGYSEGYLKNDNTIAGDNKNLTKQNIDIAGYTKLYYKCYPSVIAASLAGTYVAVLGIKTDGTKVVLRESAIIPNNPPYPQTAVEEIIDITGYTKISVSIGNLDISSGQIPLIKLFNTPYQTNAVMEYINKEVGKVSTQIDKPKGPIVLNYINAFSSSNTTVANATFTGGMLNLSGSGSYGLIKQNTLNEDSEMYIIYQENSSSNIIFGLNANNSFSNGDYAHHVTIRYNTSGTNFGKLEIVAGHNMGYSQLSTTANSNYSVGDLLKLGVIRKGLTYTFYVQNLTKGWGLKIEQTCTPTGLPFVAHNTSSPVIVSYSGSTSISEFKHICFAQSIDKAINGDSITFGQSAATEEKRWASQIVGHNLVMGGGADTTASVLSRIQEIIKINPRKVLLMIGGNDILFLVSTSVWQKNLKDIRNALVDAGIEVIHLFPTPRAGASTLITFLKTEPLFARDVKIDTNTPLMNGSTDTLAVIYDSGDHLHPNNAGHAKIAEIINNSI
ncbi:hypothetical protein DBR28_00045 [Chryseobacterium sp. HMWF028]|nr:hypothetical protein DBR28_00045 [Chryseobacterium sp. HMWF028]